MVSQNCLDTFPGLQISIETFFLFACFVYYLVPCQSYMFIAFFYSSPQGLNFLTNLNDIFIYYIRSTISSYTRKKDFPSLWHLPFTFVVSSLHLNFQVVNFQRCECAFTRPNTRQFTCLAYRQVPASSASGCASVYFTVLCCVVCSSSASLFQGQVSGRGVKAAGMSWGLLLLMVLQLYPLPPPLPPLGGNTSCLFTPCQPLCATLLHFLLYCKIKNVFYFLHF